MLSLIWNSLLVTPILNALVAFYTYTGNLGISIIALTIAIRAILIPVVVPSMKNMKKQRDLQPELNKIKKKFKNDKQKQAKEQMALFKHHTINHIIREISQIAMLIVLIALFNVIRLFAVDGDIAKINEKLYLESFRLSAEQTVETQFLWMDLSNPDPYFILAIVSGILQFIASKMMMPLAEKVKAAAKKTKPKSDDMASMMQQQTLYFMPIMSVIIGVTLPAGVVLYIVTTSLFMVVQNYFTTGWGGLQPLINRISPTAKANSINARNAKSKKK